MCSIPAPWEARSALLAEAVHAVMGIGPLTE